MLRRAGDILQLQFGLSLLFASISCGLSSVALADLLADTSAEINYEIALPADGSAGNPLPLAAHWNCGEKSGGYTPAYQLELLRQGKHLLPWFYFSRPDEFKLPDSYYEKPIKAMAALNLPISFVGTQFEYRLTEKKQFLALPQNLNPNLINQSGQLEKVLTPTADKGAWFDAGSEWSRTVIFKKIQRWYPNPPLVLFVSNNEQEKLSGRDIERSKQYLDKYGSGRDEYFKHRVIGDGWISLYRSLQNGMRSEFVAPLWKSNSLFIGYNAFESPKFGLFSGWHNYSLYYPGRLQPWPLAWDGASVSYYLRFTDASSDFRVFSPQVEAMNWVFMLDEARRQSKNYWFELSTSDGQEPKRVALSADSIRYTPDRYRGMIQFGAWLLRPRVLREFRMWDDTVKRSGAYFSAITDTVDIVYRNEDLKRFWRYGELVANDNEKHPFQENIPSEYAAISRWYLLEASTNPKSLALDTEIPVYSIALALGNKPNREWLVYAYSPLRNRKNVTITIPHFSKVTIGASVKGSFYLVSEAGLKVKPIDLLY